MATPQVSSTSSSDLELAHDEKIHQQEKNDNATATKPRNYLSHWRILVHQGITSPEIEKWDYHGSGTEDDPYQVTWIDEDPRNPMEFRASYKWMLVLAMALSVLGVSLNSSMYSGGLVSLSREFDVSTEVGTLGLSLFMLGFALGPLFWAPFSEMFGRQIVYIITYGCFTAFNAGVGGAQNIETIIILRFFAGAFGSSPLTNAGGVIADCFSARERGLAMSIFSAAPFLGPALGPVIGGFLGEAAGWRWVMGLMAAVSGLALLAGITMVPETYAPVLLRRRAERLSKITGKVYRSRVDIDRGQTTLKEQMKLALTRPWVLLIKEPIVLLLSIYMAIIYGTLYMMFGAFPIVYQQSRGWSQGIGGLAFIGILIGMIGAVSWSIFIVNPRYQKVVDKAGGIAPPEARLPPAILGGIMLPIGLFWFSWTNFPEIHWAVSIAAGIPFGMGMVLVFLSIMNYLIDSYTIFAASVMAANAVLRSSFGAAFPLFTTYMYRGLGIHWASSVPAFLALACVPFPFLFYKYGARIRAKCKFAAEAEAFMKRLRNESEEDAEHDSEPEEAEFDREMEAQEKPSHEHEGPRFEGIKTGAGTRPATDRANSLRATRSRASTRSGIRHDWDDNPYTIDRVNTRDSFRSASGIRREKSHISKPVL